MELISPLLLLPIIAAIIGYFTNWVAIKMLFRPLEEKRIFGFRIPFTPGLIPRKRKEIAKNIGETISANLVTSEGISRRLNSDSVRAKIDMAIYERLGSLLEKEWPSLEETIPERFRSEWEELVSRGEEKLAGWIKDFLESERAEEIVRTLLRDFMDDVGERRLEEVLGEEEKDVITEIVRKAVVNFTEKEGLEEEIEEYWRLKIDEILDKEKEIGSYLPQEVRQVVYRELGKWMPDLVARASGFLQDPRIRKRIKMYLFDLIDDLVEEEFDEDSVWAQLKLGVLETFVMSVDKMKMKVDEAVDEGMPKLAEIMEREEVKEQIKESFVDYVEDVLEKDLSDFEPSPEGRKKLCESLTELTVSFLRSESAREAFVGRVGNVLDSIGDRRVDDLLEVSEKSSLARRLSEVLLEALRSDRVGDKISTLVHELSETLRSKQFGPLNSYVEDRWVEEFRSLLSQKTVGVLVRKMPDIMNALDVAKIAEEEVEKFSLRDVEGLILDVTGNQLRSITWFGAIIGFFIGLAQVGIIWLGG